MSFFPGELGTAGVRHAFDLLGMWTYKSGAAQACLVTGDEAVRRPLRDRLTIPFTEGTAEIALYPFSLEQNQPLIGFFGNQRGTPPNIGRTGSPSYAAPPDMLVTTKKPKEPIFNAPIVTGCFRNIYSYRRLVHPSLAAYSIPQLVADLEQQGYQLEKLVGVYPPIFLFWWILSVMAGARFPAQHFEWEQTAMNHLSTSRQPTMTFSHILVFYARRLDC
jgi:hypothetical protein